MKFVNKLHHLFIYGCFFVLGKHLLLSSTVNTQLTEYFTLDNIHHQICIEFPPHQVILPYQIGVLQFNLF